MKRPAYTGYLLPVIAISAMLFLLIMTLSNLTAVHDEMRNSDQTNMTWVLSQTQLKGLHLQIAIRNHDGSTQSLRGLTHNLALLLSRLYLLEDGPQRRFLKTIDADHTLSAQTAAFLDIYQQTSQGRIQQHQIEALTDLLTALQQSLARISQQAMFQQWELAGSQLDSYRNTVLTAIALLVGILFCSLFISAKLLLTLKRTQETHAIELRSIELETRLISEQQSNELYRHFASMMSHQFRTPLSIMDASLQRLLRAAGPLSREELSHRVGKAREAIARLTAVLNTLLTTDKPMDTERVPSEVHDLRSIAERAISIQQFATPHALCELSACSDAGVLAHCNPGMTEQILLNLLGNAVKYGPPSQKIIVYVYRQERTACCSVTDAGGLVDDSEIPYLFERHFRGKHASKVEGSGLGLSIAQQLAQLQEGLLQVEVKPGERTTFTLSLPLAAIDANFSFSAKDTIHEK